VRYLVVSALHHDPHPTHFNLAEALDFAADVAAEATWLTHISHHMGLTAAVNPTLPPGVALATDGLEIDF
jgi:phosphoribosyl 1,2-cyclic phosphate phosphodiesterase